MKLDVLLVQLSANPYFDMQDYIILRNMQTSMGIVQKLNITIHSM